MWPKRLRDLMHAMDWDGSRTAKELGVTPTWVSRLRSGQGVFSDPMKLRIEELERLHLSRDFDVLSTGVVEEPRSTYQPRTPTPAVTISPGYEPTQPEPSEQQLVEYFMRTLSIARQIPGGRGYVFLQLKRHLSPESIEVLKE